MEEQHKNLTCRFIFPIFREVEMMAEVCQVLKVPRFSTNSIQPQMLGAWLPVLKVSYYIVQWCHSGVGCGERVVRPLGRPSLLALRSI